MGKELKLTDEVKAQLAGLLPMSKGSTYEFTPAIFESVDEKYRPTFTIKQLTTEQVNLIKEMLFKESAGGKKKSTKIRVEEMNKTNKVYMDMVFATLVDWSNLYDLGTGELLEYDGNRETMDSLPDSILTDIFSEIMRITGFIPHGLA